MSRVDGPEPALGLSRQDLEDRQHGSYDTDADHHDGCPRCGKRITYTKTVGEAGHSRDCPRFRGATAGEWVERDGEVEYDG